MSSQDMSVEDALTLLHKDMVRQGPGDVAFSLQLLKALSYIGDDGFIADLGCGTGEASFMLAEFFKRSVLSVDMSQEFIDSLITKAQNLGLDQYIEAKCADMGKLDPNLYQFDLLWSEGAAYSLTFEGALAAWRPLMAENGLAVISEMTWLQTSVPQAADKFWNTAYPQMGTVDSNCALAKQNGFETLSTKVLPAKAWWANYYDPLLKQLDNHSGTPSPILQNVIQETRQEIDLFRKFSDYYGYVFYILKAV